MKTVFEAPVGGDGGKAGLYVEGKELAVKLSIPADKILEPAMKVLDSTIDKIEKLIPGDQTGIAARLKAEARIEILELITEQDLVQSQPEPESEPKA